MNKNKCVFGVHGNELWINGSCFYQFPGLILDFIKTSDLLFIAVELPDKGELYYEPKKRFSENIFCIDLDGSLVWRRAVPEKQADYRQATHFQEAPEGKVRFVDEEGFKFEIDVDTFQVTETGWSR